MEIELLKPQTQIQSTVGRSSGCGHNHLLHRCCSCKEIARGRSDACSGEGRPMRKEQRVGLWGKDQTRAELSSRHQALPLAIRMEGNTVDRSKVTLDSSKLFLKGQVEEPGGERVVRRDSSSPSKTLQKYHSPMQTVKWGYWDQGK